MTEIIGESRADSILTESGLNRSRVTKHITASNITPKISMLESSAGASEMDFISQKVKQLKRNQKYGGYSATEFIDRFGRKKGLQNALERAKQADKASVGSVPVHQRLEKKKREL